MLLIIDEVGQLELKLEKFVGLVQANLKENGSTGPGSFLPFSLIGEEGGIVEGNVCIHREEVKQLAGRSRFDSSFTSESKKETITGREDA
ncbi:hypothetical protein KGY64_06180 [Candidatus Bipolaricaulota bacterium]|nr:hypothetical protein [Candidatus Bipolaricaulota bacterium]